ncbi:PGPGW domain-containing protein [Arthrobacter citreus]|uniref:PGPGW domain-containing protein n=1 Tax=Arthrobacter TaxID=1663 RepID=UPI0012656427|nr:PGPGW domain-containing protein [Arthrobacter gandavensis]
MNSPPVPPWLKRTGIEVVGWTLIVLGLAALILPGPGLLALVAGLAVLSLRYRWASRFLRPVKAKAFETAEKGVQTWPRISASVFSALSIMAVGVVWGVWARAPGWWPYSDKWWLPGGWGTGTGLIISGLIALSLIVYSCRKFRGRGHRGTAGTKPHLR